jgi:hypothetical protein
MLRKMAVGVACLVGTGLCILLGTGVSGAADVKVSVSFTNNTDGDFELFWLDSGKGKEVSFGVVRKGESRVQETFNTHVWVIRSPRGEELGRFTVQATPGPAPTFALAGSQADLVRRNTPGSAVVVGSTRVIAGPGAITPPANLKQELDKAIRRPPEPVVGRHPAPLKAEIDRIRAEMIRVTNVERAKVNQGATQAPGVLKGTAPGAFESRTSNPTRADRHLAPLVEDPNLSSAAQKHAEGLTETPGSGFISRRALPGLLLYHRAGQPEAANAAKAFQTWMRPMTFEQNVILSPGYTRIGVGVAYSARGVPCYTLLFAKPMP